MPKLKTHKGMKKVFIKRANDIAIGHPGQRHNTGKKNAASNRRGRTKSTLSKGDYKRIKTLI